MLRLPSEVLWGFTRFCDQTTLYALSRTCLSLRDIYRPYLDRHVVVKSGAQMYYFLQTAYRDMLTRRSGLFDLNGEPQRRNIIHSGTTSASHARKERVQTLTIEGVPPGVDEGLEVEFLVGIIHRDRQFENDHYGDLSNPLNFCLALLPNLTSLKIYDSSMQMNMANMRCLTAWAPALKVLHLFQREVDSIFLATLLPECAALEELDVNGLDLEGKKPDEMTSGNGTSNRDFPDFVILQDRCMVRCRKLATQIVMHGRLQRFASDRRGTRPEARSPLGVFLRSLCAAVDNLTVRDRKMLQSLDLRDNNVDIALLLDYLSRPASADLKRLYLNLTNNIDAPGDKEPKSNDFCASQYNAPCFFQATTDLRLACNTGLFPVAFFQRVGQRITSLQILLNEEPKEDDSILLSLQNGLLSSLNEVIVTGGNHHESYTALLRAAVVKQDPLIHFGIDDQADPVWGYH